MVKLRRMENENIIHIFEEVISKCEECSWVIVSVD